MNTFNDWLETKLVERDWKPADLANRANISRGAVSKILNQMRQPGPDVCTAIARAFRVPPEEVFRAAGLLPSLPSVDDKIINELVTIAKNLNIRERVELLEYARWRYQRQRVEYPSGGKSAGSYLQEPKADYNTDKE